MSAMLFALVAFLSTFVGGTFALRYKNRLYYILSFTAGVLLGVVSFDILPEIFKLAYEEHANSTGAMIALVTGFLLFHAIEKFVLIHHAHESDYAEHRHPQVGVFSALALIGHSFMDGVGIGLGFQVSKTVGVVMALAVIAHDFCDGLNTVSLMLVHHNTKRRTMMMLIVDALAPVFGALATLFIQVPSSLLILYLGFFAGFLLYIGASDILPEAHRNRAVPAPVLIGLTCLGAVLIFAITRLIQ